MAELKARRLKNHYRYQPNRLRFLAPQHMKNFSRSIPWIGPVVIGFVIVKLIFFLFPYLFPAPKYWPDKPGAPAHTSAWMVRSYLGNSDRLLGNPNYESNVSDVWRFHRTDDGEGVFIQGGHGPYAMEAWIIRTNSVRHVESNHRWPYFDELGREVAWVEGNKMSFKDGFTLMLPQFNAADIDVTGRYFMANTVVNNYSCWVGRIGQENEVLWSNTNEPDFTCNGIQSVEEKVFLFGKAADCHGVCLILKKADGKFSTETRIDLDLFPYGSTKILDTDLSGEALLVLNEKVFPGVSEAFVYNIATRKASKCDGHVRYSAFLKVDPIPPVSEDWEKKKIFTNAPSFQNDSSFKKSFSELKS